MNNRIYSYRDLEVYQLAFELALSIHRFTMKFPKHETYEMGQQMRNASKRIPACIAEGFGKKDSELEFKRFISISHGSVQEMKVWLEFSEAFQYVREREIKELWERYDKLGRKLYRLKESWKTYSRKRDSDI